MAFDWVAAENALANWLKVGAGVAIVLWLNQGGPYPATPFVSLNVTGLRSIGWPDVVDSYDAARPLGEEIKLESRDVIAMTVSAQAYASQSNVTGQNSAKAMLSRARTRLGLESVQLALKAAGLGIWDRGQVADLTGLFQTGFESRAALDVVFGITESVEEFTGYIAKMGVEVEWQPRPPRYFEIAV